MHDDVLVVDGALTHPLTGPYSPHWQVLRIQGMTTSSWL